MNSPVSTRALGAHGPGRLGIGRAFSSCGDQLIELVVIWTVWQATESAAMTGLAAFAQRAPLWLFGFVGASVVDRTGPTAMLWRGNLAAFLIAITGLVAVHLGAPLALAVTISSVAIASVRSLEAPALTALVPTLVENAQAQALNSTLDNAKRIGRLAAPAPALLLGSVPPQSLILLAGIFYLVMAWGARSVGNELMPSARTTASGRSSALESVRLVYGSGQLGLVLGASVLYAVLHGAAYFSILPKILLTKWDGQIDAYAAIVAAFALGGIAANFTLGKIHINRHALAVCLGMAVAGVSFALLGQVSGLLALWIVAFIGGASLPYQDISIICLIQKQAPSGSLARAHAIWRFGCELGLGVGMVCGGLLADLVEPSALIVIVGTGILLVGAVVAQRL